MGVNQVFADDQVHGDGGSDSRLFKEKREEAWKRNEVVSIIIPIYNVEAYLRQCLKTVVHRTYPHLEIILIMMVARPVRRDIVKRIF